MLFSQRKMNQNTYFESGNPVAQFPQNSSQLHPCATRDGLKLMGQELKKPDKFCCNLHRYFRLIFFSNRLFLTDFAQKMFGSQMVVKIMVIGSHGRIRKTIVIYHGLMVG